MIPTPLLAHNPAGMLSAFVFVLLLLPITYMGICLIGFTVGSIGNWRGLLRVFLSSLFCLLLVFCVILPADVWLVFKGTPSAPQESPIWLKCSHAILYTLVAMVPLWISRAYTKQSWLRSALITLVIACGSVLAGAALFLTGGVMFIMSQM